MSEAEVPFGTGDSSFQAAGGLDGIRSLVDDFYRIMDESREAEIIRGMHPPDLKESRDKLTLFLSGWLGGPKLFAEKYGPIKIPMAHKHLAIGSNERDAWLLCMKKAIQNRPYSEAFADYLLAQLRIPADRVLQVSRDPGSD